MLHCDLCETCPLKELQSSLPETISLTELSLITHPDDAAYILHVMQGRPLEEPFDFRVEQRRQKIAEKLSHLSDLGLEQAVAFSTCFIRKTDNQCPMPDDEFSHADFRLSS